MVVLEALEHAQARGAQPLAEVLGYGVSADAAHLVAPPEGGEGAARAMRQALRAAGLEPEEIDYISAHATATEVGDIAETNAIRAVFGEQAYRVPVTALKSQIGHLLGAAGGVETIAAVQTLRTGADSRRRSTSIIRTRSAIWTTCRTRRVAPRCGRCSRTRSASGGRTRCWCCAASTSRGPDPPSLDDRGYAAGPPVARGLHRLHPRAPGQSC